MTDIPFTEPVFAEQRGAVIDGPYRYHLTRRWAALGATLLFVMLNPSTADGTTDDFTIKKCRRFARIKGFTAIEIVNLYAYRATDPSDLKLAGYPVGPLNDAWIRARAYTVTKDGGRVCVAWGAAAPRDRAIEVMRGLKRLGIEVVSFDVTKAGHPAHPLYLSSMSSFKVFDYAEIA